MNIPPRANYGLWYRTVTDKMNVSVDLSEYDFLSLDSALAMAAALTKEASVHIASWSLETDVDAYIPYLSGSVKIMERLKFDLEWGGEYDSMARDIVQLFENIACIGSIALHIGPLSFKKVVLGQTLQDFGYYLSTTSHFEHSAMNFPMDDFMFARNSTNRIMADSALDSTNFSGGERLAVQSLRDRVQYKNEVNSNETI